MRDFERRNQHFDRLVNTPGLRWMGQNTNHFPAHPQVLEAMAECIRREEFHAYAPPLGLEELRELVLRDLGLTGFTAAMSDGGVSGLYHVCRTFCRPGDQLLTTDPTWAWPVAFARAAGAEVVQIPIYGDEYGYRLAPERLRAALTPRTRMIYIVDPNNPIGSACTADEIRAIAQIAREAGAFLVHDCTYRDFAYAHTLAAQYYPERTITVYSFSKWLGFAGLRIGALVANADIVEELAAAPPNNLGSNIVAQRGAIAGLRAKAEWFPPVLAAQRRNQELVRAAAERIPGLRLPVFPSHANFLVLECGEAGVRPEAVCAVLAERKLLVRQGSYHSKRFGDRFIKISTSVPEEWAQELCAALPAAVKAAQSRAAVAPLY